MTGLYRKSNARRRQFVQLLTDLDQYWIEVLGNKLFHDLNYYDLFTQMWLKIDSSEDDTFRKSELYKLMPHISQRTAIKYIQTAIDHGLLIERTDPQDQRSRQITMSADLKRKIEFFLDHSISILQETSWRPIEYSVKSGDRIKRLRDIFDDVVNMLNSNRYPHETR
jgi:hypothetical protein